MLPYFLSACALLALVFIVFEERSGISKAKSTLFFGCASWIAMYVDAAPGLRPGLTASFQANLLEIATLWLFLVSSMTFVAYINRRGLIDAFMRSVLPAQMSVRNLFYTMTCVAFGFSLLCDNATTALVVTSVVVPLELKPEVRLKFATIIVFAVTAAGVALITGDVTTVMIFLAGKVKITSLLLLGLATFSAVAVLALLLGHGLEGRIDLSQAYKRQFAYNPVDMVIASLFLLTIIGTMLLNIYCAIPPVLTFLFGLSLMLIVGSYRGGDTIRHMLDYIRQIEFDSLLFFLGVLLLVGMLARIHVLDSVANLYHVLPTTQTTYLIGLLAGVIGNVPLTAVVLKAGIAMDEHGWMELVYAVVMGGTLIVTGSAAGIVTMGKLQGVSVVTYSRMLPYLLVAYSFGFGVVVLFEPWVA